MKRIASLLLVVALCVTLAACDLFAVGGGTTEPTTVTSTTAPTGGGEPQVSTRDPNALQVHYIDCGQADSILIRTPTGETMLIDAGDTGDSRDAVLAYLAAEQITQLDWLVLTHPHADHIGGAKAVLTDVGATKVLLPDKVHTTKLFANVLDAILDTNAALYTVSDKAATETALYDEGMDPTVMAAGSTFSLGAATFRILGPVHYNYGSNMNEYSVMLHLTYGAHSFLFTGDAETEAEEDALAKFGADAFRCNVYKSGHHGSDTSSAQALVNATGAAISVISVGTDNDYGHPCQVTLAKYDAAGMRTYRTDLLGTVIVQTDGTTLSVVGETPTDTTTPPVSGSVSVSDTEPDAPALSGKLEMHTIACGAGEAILLKTPDGKTMLVDTGTNNNTSRNIVKDYLALQGVESLDWLVLTNNHQDHIGGAVLMANDFTPANVLIPNKAHTSQVYKNTINALIDKAGTVYAAGENLSSGLADLGLTPTVFSIGDSISLGADVRVQVLAPLTYVGATTLGDSSIVLRVTYQNTAFLLTSNIDADIEADLLTAYPDTLAADVLKVANHGSTAASTDAFLSAVSPTFAVVSSADAADTALAERLTTAGVTTFSQTINGTVVYESNGNTVTLRASA